MIPIYFRKEIRLSLFQKSGVFIPVDERLREIIFSYIFKDIVRFFVF